MAGAGYYDYSTNEVLTAQNVQQYIQDQAVQVYENAEARDLALGAEVSEGMVTFLKDTGRLEVYSAEIEGQPYTPLVYNRGAGKNHLLNGDFSVCQRARFDDPTAIETSRVGRHYVFDAWAATSYVNNGGVNSTLVQRRKWGNASNNICPVPRYEASSYMRITSTLFQTLIDQRIENVATLNDKTVTLSFYVRNIEGDVTVRFTQNFGTSGSAPVVIEKTIATGNPYFETFSRFQVSVDLPTIVGKTVGANSYLMVEISTPLIDRSIDFWGIQLEEGDFATEFTRSNPDYALELQACQRNFVRFQAQRPEDSFTDTNWLAEGVATVNNTAQFGVIFPVNMRALPTIFGNFLQVTIPNVSGVGLSGQPTIVANSLSTQTALVSATIGATSLVVGTSYFLGTTFPEGYLDFSCEL
jgi:hypothetical protein